MHPWQQRLILYFRSFDNYANTTFLNRTKADAISRKDIRMGASPLRCFLRHDNIGSFSKSGVSVRLMGCAAPISQLRFESDKAPLWRPCEDIRNAGSVVPLGCGFNHTPRGAPFLKQFQKVLNKVGFPCVLDIAGSDVGL